MGCKHMGMAYLPRDIYPGIHIEAVLWGVWVSKVTGEGESGFTPKGVGQLQHMLACKT